MRVAEFSFFLIQIYCIDELSRDRFQFSLTHVHACIILQTADKYSYFFAGSRLMFNYEKKSRQKSEAYCTDDSTGYLAAYRSCVSVVFRNNFFLRILFVYLVVISLLFIDFIILA